MANELDGQRAIVTGGGGGIGSACARLLARDGAQVTIVGRTESTLRATQSRLADEGLTVECFAADALDALAVRAAVDAAADEEGRLHIAVSVPGGSRFKPVLLYDDDKFDEDVRKNVRPAFLLLKYAGRAMVRAGGGSFVSISSHAASMSTMYLSSYSAGKAAVDQLVRVAANELGRLNIRVNSIQPGMTRTNANTGNWDNAALMQEILDHQALARHGEADDQARAVRYFAGPESGWVTGQVLIVDGGHTLRGFIDNAKLFTLPDQGDPANFT
jgi:NAD(P)-dependent dehydrogenase (short-subunit alcohol dehydrogenase family)